LASSTQAFWVMKRRTTLRKKLPIWVTNLISKFYLQTFMRKQGNLLASNFVHIWKSLLELGQCTLLFIKIKTIIFCPWYFNKLLTRKEIVLTNKIRSNHYNLNYSIFQKNIVISAACLCVATQNKI